MAKVSVITGGAGGIGIETVKLLAKEASVLVVDFQEERIAIAKAVSYTHLTLPTNSRV